MSLLQDNITQVNKKTQHKVSQENNIDGVNKSSASNLSFPRMYYYNIL